MKVLIIDEKQGTAINILSNFIKKHNRQHQIDILSLHPKRPDQETITFLKEHWQEYDIIHYQYWKSWKKAVELVPEISSAKSILSHYNPYDVEKENWWQSHKEVVFCNEAQRDKVGRGTIIRLGVDESLWTYQENEERTIGICANRIEGKKGVKEIAEVAKELGLKFIVMGRVSKPDYWQEVLNTGADIEFHESVPFDKMPDIYHKMGVYVCNSVDDFETGPMPVLEASLSGIPVVSRKVGTVAEIYESKSIVFFDGKEEMKSAINEAFDRRGELRNEGWNVAKGMNSVKYAWEYNKIYHKTLFGGYPLVSIIVPYVPSRASSLKQIHESVAGQTYKNVEIIPMVDDEEGYNLAKVRNKAIIQARGEYLLFLDDRLVLDSPDTIQAFLDKHNKRHNVFVWGDKGAGKRKFVENFSFTRRQDLIDAGMFNEQVNMYGGMSQEIRSRLNKQGWHFKFCEFANAREVIVSRSKSKRKDDIMKAKILLYKLGL